MLRTRFSLLFALMLAMAATLIGVARAEVSASTEVLIIEQDYNIVQADKELVGKDIRQKLYIAPDWVRIDEFGASDRVPTETYLIDFKTETLVNLDHEKLIKVTETFTERRNRIEEKKKKTQKMLADLPNGPQKDKTESMYRGMLDDKAKYKVVQPGDKSTILKVECAKVEIPDSRLKDYTPMTVYVHPTQELPYDSAEVLYLLQLMGGKLKDFMAENKAIFRRIPMRLDLQLAAGGKLHTEVVNIEKKTLADLEKQFPGIRAVPEQFKERPLDPRARPKTDTPPATPDGKVKPD